MLQSIEVQSVGPLSGLRVDLGQNNLIIGTNESGKTTLVDLLSKKLMDRLSGKNPVKAFKKITGISTERYGGEEAWRYSISGDIDLELAMKDAAVDALALLVVRANRNDIVNKDDADISSIAFWKTTIKSMISGSDILTKKFAALKEHANTNTRVWNIPERLAEYKNLLSDKRDSVRKFRTSLELDASNAEDLKQIVNRLEQLKKIRDAAEFVKKDRVYGQLCRLNDEIETLAKELSRDDAGELAASSRNWGAIDDELKNHTARLSAIRNEIARVCQKAAGDAEMIKSLKAELSKREEKYAGIASPDCNVEVNGALADLQNKKESVSLSMKKFTVPVVSFICFALGVIAAGAGYFSLYSFIGTGIFAIIGVALLARRKKAIDMENRKALEAIAALDNDIRAKEILLEAGKLQARKDIEERDALYSNIKTIKSDLEKKERQVAETEQNLAALQTEEKKVIDDIETKKRVIEEYTRKYITQQDLGKKISSFETGHKELTIKKDLLGKTEAEAKRIFGVTVLSLHDLLARLEKHRESIDESYIGQDMNVKELDELNRKRELIIKNRHAHEKDFEKIKAEIVRDCAAGLKKVIAAVPESGRDFYDLYFSDMIDALEIQSVFEIDAALERCASAIETMGRYREYADYIFSALESMESRQDTLIRSILSDEGFKRNISLLMNYDDVDVSIDGDRVNFYFGQERYPFTDISTGAAHQFYFAFRMALLDKVMAGPSTIILDDAFIHFDHERRVRAVALLKNYSERGWQFVYTAIEDHAIDRVFSQVFGDAGNLTVVRLEGRR